MNLAPVPTFTRAALVAGAGFALLAVLIGAFAAHGLQPLLDAYQLDLIETAARYQMYHALALLTVAILTLTAHGSARWLKVAAYTFALGIILFSGSLYLLALSGITWLGAITPLGGLALVFGWLALIIAALKQGDQSRQ